MGWSTSHRFDDAQVAHRAVAERRQRHWVVGAIVHGQGLLEDVELDEHGALFAAVRS